MFLIKTLCFKYFTKCINILVRSFKKVYFIYERQCNPRQQRLDAFRRRTLIEVEMIGVGYTNMYTRILY
jgi:hypothetical protein